MQIGDHNSKWDSTSPPNIFKQCARWRLDKKWYLRTWLMRVACCCSWGPGVCFHMLPSFHSHEPSLLAKPRISNLRVHVKSADMCVQLVSALSNMSNIIYRIVWISMVSSKHPEECDCYENFLVDRVACKNVQKQYLGNYQLVRTASRSHTTATLLRKLFYVSVDTICWLPK